MSNDPVGYSSPDNSGSALNLGRFGRGHSSNPALACKMDDVRGAAASVLSNAPPFGP